MLKEFIVARKVRKAGDLLVSCIKCNDNVKLYYSVNEITGHYSFWSYKLGSKLVLEDSDLTTSKALFKLVLLGASI